MLTFKCAGKYFHSQYLLTSSVYPIDSVCVCVCVCAHMLE